MKAQHIIACMGGFNKWTDLASASDAELRVAKLLFDNRESVNVEEWQDYLRGVKRDNAVELDPEAQYQILSQVWLELPPENGHADIRIPESVVVSEQVKQSDFRDLAVSLAYDCLNQQSNPFGLNARKLEFTTEVEMKSGETDVQFTVWFNYPSSEGKHSSHAKVDVRFPRVAGNAGYGKPEIMPTFYTGKTRDPDFRLKHAIT